MAKKKTRYQKIQEKLRKQKKRARKKARREAMVPFVVRAPEPPPERKSRLVFLAPTADTSKTKLGRKLPGAVKNALEIAIRLGTEKIVSHEDVLPVLQAEFGSELGKEAFISWDQTEEIYFIKTLTILGHPRTPDEALIEALSWASPPDISREEIYPIYLHFLVSPIIDAVVQLVHFWEKEDITIFIIDQHAIQMVFLLSLYLDLPDLILPVTGDPCDTYRKFAALKAALATERGKEGEVFVQTYLDLARRDESSHQARYLRLRGIVWV